MSAEDNFKICSNGKCEECKYKDTQECKVVLRAIYMLENPEFYEVEHK